MQLHLGVIDQPYVTANKGVTTGDVAEILEGKYHVMETFWQMRQAEIVTTLEESAAGVLESMLMGAPPRNDLYGSGTSKIEGMFQQFLDSKAMDGQAPGVPTQAALDGVNHRFKSGRGPKPRPSFIDTGLYQASMRAWVE